MNSHVLHEITPLMDKDILYIVERHKKEFTYPIHCHEVCELNFVENAKGVRRIVGDSSEVIGDYDLVLISSNELEHVWEQGDCHSDDIREITVQFDLGDLNDGLLTKTPFNNIRKMLIEAQKGIAFPISTIIKIYDKLENLGHQGDKFMATMQFLEILNTLATSEGMRTLATTSYAKVDIEDDSRRILKVKNYIAENYMNDLMLEDLSGIANMSKSSFSRFFKQHTGRTLSDYIIDIRMGNATRMLIDTNESVGEICFKCGYNNMSNFNRIFKRKKGCTPSEFREQYKKVRIII